MREGDVSDDYKYRYPIGALHLESFRNGFSEVQIT